jgi:hypothetical protein
MNHLPNDNISRYELHILPATTIGPARALLKKSLPCSGLHHLRFISICGKLSGKYFHKFSNLECEYIL